MSAEITIKSTYKIVAPPIVAMYLLRFKFVLKKIYTEPGAICGMNGMGEISKRKEGQQKREVISNLNLPFYRRFKF